MKRMLVTLAAILITTSAGLAVGRSADTTAGKVYVNNRGMTLYMLSSDQPSRSTCYAKCTQIWPPYIASAGAKMKRGWSIVTRQDGSRMWAYRGHPLYAFFKDQKPGDANGEGIHDQWGWWHVATVGGGYVSRPVATYHPQVKAGRSYSSGSYSGGASGGMSGY